MRFRRLPSRAALVVAVAALAWTAAAPAHARPHQRHPRRHYHAVVVRPRAGHVVKVLPRSFHVVRWHGTPYRYYQGIFYRPHGASFVVVAPPIGIHVALLPVGHVVIHVGTRPFFVYNDVWYVWDADTDDYVVVERPEDVSESKGVVAYPAKDQDADQQARDRYECHAWAVNESGFDPSLGRAGSDAERSRYDRAMAACLEGRGYTVR